MRTRTAHVPGAALAVLAAVQFMVILDASIVNVALPTVQRGLDLSPGALSWVVDGYLIAFAGLLLLGGRLSDVLPPRAVFQAGLAVFTVASAAAAAAPNGPLLLAARVVQGAGGAIVAPAALSIVLKLFADGPDRRRALGVWGGVSGAGGVAGVLLGGLLSSSLGWPAIFLINVPVGVAVALLVRRVVPELPARRGRFDLAGAIAVTASLGAVAYGLVSGPEHGWTDVRVVVGLLVGVLAAGVFVVVERRAPAPLVPLRVFRQGSLMTANAVVLVVGGVQVGFFFFLPQYQQHVLGMSAARTSLAQIPIALAITASSLAASRVAARFGTRPALIWSLFALIGGIAWLAPARTDARFVTGLLGPFLLVGVGLGLSFVLVTTLAVAGAADDGGLVSGLMNTSRQIGGTLGLATLVAVSAPASVGTQPDYTAAFLTAAALAVIAVLFSCVPALGRDGAPAHHGEPGEVHALARQ